MTPVDIAQAQSDSAHKAVIRFIVLPLLRGFVYFFFFGLLRSDLAG
jgi:hypothetical protein